MTSGGGLKVLRPFADKAAQVGTPNNWRAAIAVAMPSATPRRRCSGSHSRTAAPLIVLVTGKNFLRGSGAPAQYKAVAVTVPSSGDTTGASTAGKRPTILP